MRTRLHDVLEHAATATSTREALVQGDRRVTYGEMLQISSRLAEALAHEGVRRRDRVAIWLDKSIEEACAFFAISMANGVSVPVNTLLKQRQVAHILDDCGVRFLVTDSAKLESLRGKLPGLKHLECAVVVDGCPAGVPLRVQPLAAEGPSTFAARSDGVAKDLAAILYTSGSTGSPKGVMVSHENLIAGSRIVRAYLGITASDRILSVLPFSFDAGLNQLITSVDSQAALVLLRFSFGEEIVRAIKAERCTGLAGVPTIWAILIGSSPTFRREPLSSLRYITNTGGPVPSATIKKIRRAQPHVDFFLMYGLTEAFRSTYLPPDQIDARPTSIGKAIPETEIFVLGEDGRVCGPEEEGILVHRGPTVSLGYWNRPEDTARVLRPNPTISPDQGADTVCFSGDRVTTDREGYLYFVARDDAMIKSSGYRISPSEVEEVIMDAGGIAQVAVIGIPDSSIGERIHAVCVAEAGADIDETKVLEHCASELPRHMLPRGAEFVAELPRTPNGKVDYKQLKGERGGKPSGSPMR